MKLRLFVLFLLLLTLTLSAGATAAQRQSVEVPILMYHKVTKDPGQIGKFAITPAELEADLKFIAESTFTPVTMADLIAFVAGERSLPERPVILTFDDGFFSDYHYLFPLVCQYQVPVVSSIIGKPTDEYTAEGREDIIYPHLIWPQVQEMAGSGFVEFQNHSYDLHCTLHGAAGAERRQGESEAAYTDRLDADLRKLQRRIQEMLGRAPTTFTYPFGAKSEGSDGVLRILGFSASLMAVSRPNTITVGDPDCLFSLGRILRPHGRSAEEILG
ncbi:MAG: polysaccharide deacetylase family protein [Oscillospiraceae bacterium]|nr:polysaccharide deacetylase family protein [Oscillospiraceae bacterium]